MTTAWNDGVDVYVTRQDEPVRFVTLIVGLLLVVVAPLAAAGWALTQWWPLSGLIWLGAAALFWGAMLATAIEVADD
jgi:hypothetical protein